MSSATGAGATVRVRRMEGTAHDVIGRGAGFRPFAIGGLTGGREAVLAQWRPGGSTRPRVPAGAAPDGGAERQGVPSAGPTRGSRGG